MASEEDEVAEDYRTALEELSFNNRNEISNLTAIARDYTAHSLKIAEVLQEHILKVRRNVYIVQAEAIAFGSGRASRPHALSWSVSSSADSFHVDRPQ